MIPRGPFLLTALLALSTVSMTDAADAPQCADAGPWEQLVLAHRDRYPAMEVRDALKLLQQATMGSEHWVREGEAAAWMRREWDALGDGPGEPLVDSLGPGARFARIHLRPYRTAGGDPDDLVRVFVETATAAPADTAVLRCALDALTGLARRGAVPWPSDSVAAAVRDWAARGFPAIHHSTAFAERYRPAYRVVALPLVPRALPGPTRQDTTRS